MSQLETVTLQLPRAVAEALNTAEKQFAAEIIQRGLRDLRIEQALKQYAEGGLSFGATAELAGVSQAELAQHAFARGMEPPFEENLVQEGWRT